jgi:hypothetical protein
MLQAALTRAPEDRKPSIRDALTETRRALAAAPPPPTAAAASPPPPTTATATPPATAPTQAEIVLWKSIENSTNAVDFYGYLDKYPNGTYAPIAKARIAARLQSSRTSDQKVGDLVARIVALTNNVKTRGETQNVFASGCVLNVVRVISNRSSTQTLDLRLSNESDLKVTNDAGTWEIAGLVSKQDPGSKSPARASLRAADQAGVSELYAALPEAIQLCKAMVAPGGGPLPAANKGLPPVNRSADPKQAAFSSAWRCSYQSTVQSDGKLEQRTYKQYQNVEFRETGFASNLIGGRFNKAPTKDSGVPADGVWRAGGEGEDKYKTRAAWQGETFVVETTSDSASSTTQYHLVDDALQIDRISEADVPQIDERSTSRRVHFRITERASCERVSLVDATAAMDGFKDKVQEALDGVVRFVRSNAVRVANVERSDPDDCELRFVGPDGPYVDDPLGPIKVTFLPVIVDYFQVERTKGGEFYRISPYFWFHTSDAARRLVQLSRAAAELCEKWSDYPLGRLEDVPR